MTIDRMLAIVIMTLVTTSVGVGLYVISSPAEQRMMKLDDQRLRDLKKLSDRVDRYWVAFEMLPETLEDMLGAQQSDRVPKDPVSEKAYDYEVVGDNQYRLCAVFDMASRESARLDDWYHEVGDWCFTITPANSEVPRPKSPLVQGAQKF